MIYDSQTHDAIFKLSLEESGVLTTCDIHTLETDEYNPITVHTPHHTHTSNYIVYFYNNNYNMYVYMFMCLLYNGYNVV